MSCSLCVNNILKPFDLCVTFHMMLSKVQPYSVLTSTVPDRRLRIIASLEGGISILYLIHENFPGNVAGILAEEIAACFYWGRQVVDSLYLNKSRQMMRHAAVNAYV